MRFGLVVEEPCEAFEPGEIHPRRKSCACRDQDDPEQPLADAHLIPGVAPRCERQLQGGPEGCRLLLGYEACAPNPPCAISVPNLMTDRPHWLDGGRARLNIRRLMYQSLIWAAVLGDEARGLRSPFNREDVERAANALVDRVRRDVELGRNFLRR